MEKDFYKELDIKVRLELHLNTIMEINETMEVIFLNEFVLKIKQFKNFKRITLERKSRKFGDKVYELYKFVHNFDLNADIEELNIDDVAEMIENIILNKE